MAHQLVVELVQGEAYVAVVAVWHPAAVLAFNHCRVASSVLEQDNLFARSYSFVYCPYEGRVEVPFVYLAEICIFHVGNLDRRQLHIAISLGEFHQFVASLHCIVVRFD